MAYEIWEHTTIHILRAPHYHTCRQGNATLALIFSWQDGRSSADPPYLVVPSYAGLGADAGTFFNTAAMTAPPMPACTPSRIGSTIVNVRVERFVKP
jgi:hypothetical protein